MYPESPLRTVIHEIGHTIGLGDFFGDNVMVSGGDASNISSSNIAEILKHAGFKIRGTWSGGYPDVNKPTHSIIDLDYRNYEWIGKLR